MSDFKEVEAARRALMERIESLESQLSGKEFQISQMSMLNIPWAGNLGQWWWAPKDNVVKFNEKKATTLGYLREELPKKVTHQFFTDKLHPEDYDRVMDNMMEHLLGKSEAYEVEYRIRCKNGSYRWYYDRGVATKRDDKGMAEMLVGIVFDVTDRYELMAELERKNKALEDLSQRDYLTGLYNRRYFMTMAQSEIKKARRMGLAITAVMCDIDNFKKINDTYGHDMGDKVLITFARQVMHRIRETDIAARWGGEEFIILLLDTGIEDGRCLAEDIRRIIAGTEFEEEISLTASFGVLELSLDGPMEEQLVTLDGRMYAAKKCGKNRVISEDCHSFD